MLPWVLLHRVIPEHSSPPCALAIYSPRTTLGITARRRHSSDARSNSAGAAGIAWGANNRPAFCFLARFFLVWLIPYSRFPGLRVLVFGAYWNYNLREYQFPGYLRALNRLPTSRGSLTTDPTTDSIYLRFREFTVGAHQAGSLLISF
jgi:hypothetical protein